MKYRIPILEFYEFQQAILDKDLSIPPSSPNKGDRYIVKSPGLGDWFGKDKNITYYDGNIWKFDAPMEGMLTFVKDENKFYQYSNSAWSLLFESLGLSDMLKSVYDVDNNGIVDKAETVDDGEGNASAAVAIKDSITKKHEHTNKTILDSIESAFTNALKNSYDSAVSSKHTQNTDQYLDYGGDNEISASQIKSKITNDHLHSNITILDAIQESFTTVLKNAYDSCVLKEHTHTNKSILDSIQEALTTALKTAYDGAVTHAGLISGNPHQVTKSDVGLANVDNKSEATIITDVKADTDVASAISSKHTQGTDQYLDHGGVNQSAAADVKDAVDKKHAAVTAGDGIGVVGQVISNSDKGSTAVSAHEGTYTHGDIAHSNRATLDTIQEALTTILKSSYDAAVTASHSHSNKVTLDAIEQALTTALKLAYDDAVTKAHTQNTDYILVLNTSGLPALIEDGTLKEDLLVTALKKIDGRDLSVDGSKLDDIEAGAVALATVKADGDIASAISLKHSHANQATLDSIQEALTTALKNNYDTAYTHSQIITGNPHNLVASEIGTNSSGVSVQDTLDAIDPSVKADKVIGAVNGNLAGLDASGNLIDSGVAPGDIYAPQSDDQTASEVPTNESGVSVQDHIDNTSNPHAVTKAQVGLTNVDDKSEATIITDVKADTDVADAVAKKHTYGSDNQTADTVPTEDSGVSVQDALNTLEVNSHAASNQFNKATAGEITALTDKATPVDADVILGEDSASGTAFSKIKLAWSSIKSTLKTYFDGIYQTVLGFTPENSSNKVTSFQETPDDAHYASEKLVKDSLDSKQDSLGFTAVPNTRKINGKTLDGDVNLTSDDISTSESGISVQDKLDTIINPMLYKGGITSSSDFPTPSSVQTGWTYTILADVTDNDETKTNTEQSFLQNAEIAWNGTNWTQLGYSAVKSVAGKTGIVTLDTNDITEVSNKKYITDAEETILENTSGVNTGDQSASEVPTNASGVSVQDHIDNTSNPHSVTKTQVGLTNVDDKSEATIITDVKADSDVASAISSKHSKSHSITSSSDHTSTATAGKLLKADANGLPVDATNTDTEVSDAITKKHAYGSDVELIIKVLNDDENLSTGDGKMYITIPSVFNGMNLVAVAAHVYTASSSGNPSIALYNNTDSVDMLSTNCTIDANEKDSKDATTAAVIDTAHDDVATGDEIRCDVDASGTSTKGLELRLRFG